MNELLSEQMLSFIHNFVPCDHIALHLRLSRIQFVDVLICKIADVISAVGLIKNVRIFFQTSK